MMPLEKVPECSPLRLRHNQIDLKNEVQIDYCLRIMEVVPSGTHLDLYPDKER